MNVSYKPVRSKSISDQVFEQLRELIFRSDLKPGEQLPSERELSTMMKVSRTSVRNAIGKLVVLGYLVNKQGQGTFVASPDSLERNPLALALGMHEGTLEDLLEVRLGMECHAAALAAERATKKDTDSMEKSLNKMKSEIKAGLLGTNEDISFHMAIAFATKNPVQVHVMKTFHDLLFFGIESNLLHLYDDTKQLEDIIKHHTDILHAIQSHDPQKAFASMRHHILYVLNFLKNQV